MNPLLTLWLLVLGMSVLLGGVFYLADHHLETVGNLWFLLSVFFGSYGLYILINWIIQRRKRKLDH